MFHIPTSPNVAVFPDSLQTPSLLDICGFPGRALPDLFIFSDSLHHSLPFPIVFIFRLGHLGTCPPSSRRVSYPIVFPDVSVFHLRRFPVFSRLLLDSFPVPSVPDISLSHSEVSGCFCLHNSLLLP